jgi:phage N-6-adenine-methyltransferase
MKTAVHFSSAHDLWSTPQDFFERLNADFHFETDVCALPENAKCRRYYTTPGGMLYESIWQGPAHLDGLIQQWAGVCWMNPPYGREIGRWMAKAYRSAQAGATVVCLVPSRTDTAWWHDYATKGEIIFIRGRLKFGGSANCAPFPSAVVVYRPPS